jgi:hypothetical protein
MDRTPGAFGNRCLPMLTANASGWWITTGEAFRATWDGTDGADGLEVSGVGVSHFGGGVLTITLPYLFRTSPGLDLLVRGPSNLPKRGASCLEGLVETDWNPATYTLNWRLTEPGREVVWEAGEPVAMLVPQARGFLESVKPEVMNIGDAPDVWAEFERWQRGREQFLRDLKGGCPHAAKDGWQKDYVQGARVKRRALREPGGPA